MTNIQVVLGMFAIALFAGNIGASNDCPYFYTRVGEKCYRYLEISVPYDSAVAECAATNARVVVPRTREQIQLLTDMMFDTRGEIGAIWIGCDDRKEEGTFVCLDNEPIHSSLRWAHGKPDNGKGRCFQIEEDCISLSFNGYLQDRPCHWASGVMCEAL